MRAHIRWLTLVIPIIMLAAMSVNNGCNPLPTRSPTPRPTVIDEGLLYGEPCNPPCWESITPGISSEEDVASILEHLELEGRIDEYTKSGIHYRATFPASGGGLDIIFSEDGYVEVISLSYRGTHSFRVWRVIERFGEPEAFVPYAEFERSAPCPCEDWDDAIYNTAPSRSGMLLYPSQGMSVGVTIPKKYRGCVCPEMMTPGFVFYEPTSLEEALHEGRAPVFFWDDLSSENLIPWHGYGDGY